MRQHEKLRMVHAVVYPANAFDSHLLEVIRYRLVQVRQTLKKMNYRKTPLISMYVFSGLAMVQVLIFGGRTYFFWGGGGV